MVPPLQKAVINTLYVEPLARRQGIATLLLAEAERRCKTLNIMGIALGLFDANHAAAAVYGKAGYVTTRRSMWRSLK